MPKLGRNDIFRRFDCLDSVGESSSDIFITEAVRSEVVRSEVERHPRGNLVGSEIFRWSEVDLCEKWGVGFDSPLSRRGG